MNSETGQALDMIGSAQSGDTSQRGPGGPSHGHVLGDVDVGTVAAPGLRILQDEIRSSLRKAQKMQVSQYSELYHHSFLISVGCQNTSAPDPTACDADNPSLR